MELIFRRNIEKNIRAKFGKNIKYERYWTKQRDDDRNKKPSTIKWKLEK